MNDMTQSPEQGTDLATDMIYKLEQIKSWEVEIEKGLLCTDGAYSFNDIVAMTLCGELVFFNFADCFCFCKIVPFPGYNAWHFFLAGGDLQEIIKLKPYFNQIALENDCRKLSFSGRRGWLRALKNEGWQEALCTMHHEVY